MQIIPHSKHDWLRFVVFPLKAYVIIAPVLIPIVALLFPRSRHSPPDAAYILLQPLYLDALILVFAALLFAIFGPNGHAFSCVRFAIAAFLIAFMLLPTAM